MIPDQQQDFAPQLAKALGTVFLASGAVALLALLVLFFQLMNDPESAFSTTAFAEFLQSDAPPVTVEIDGREAVIDFDPALRRLLAIFVAAIAIIAIGSVLHACIGGGLQLLRFADKKKNSGLQQN